MKKILFILLTVAFILSPIFGNLTLAQEVQEEDVPDDLLPACFEYYPYAQLDVSANLDKDIYQPLEDATLSLEVTNNNPNTSIANGKVIFQIRKPMEETNTTILLSEQVLASKLSYPSLETKEGSFSFKIPESLPAGLYYGYITITDNDFPISGLNFTQDVTGVVVGFFVQDASEEEFNIPYIKETKAEITHNSGSVSANAFLPPPEILLSDLPAIINVPIYNPKDVQVNTYISSNLYYWDENNELVKTQEQDFTIDSKSDKTFSFEIPEDIHAGTYMLRTVLSSGDSQVISKIRFSVPGFAPIVYYSGVSKDENGKEVIFTCIGNSAGLSKQKSEEEIFKILESGEILESNLTQGRTTLVLSDTDTNEEVGRLDFEGELYTETAPGFHIKDLVTDFPGNAALKTVIYDKDGNLVYEKEIFYEESPKESSDNFKFIIYIIIAIIIAVLFVLFRKFHKDENSLGSKMTMFILILFISTVLGGTFMVNSANAASSWGSWIFTERVTNCTTWNGASYSTRGASTGGPQYTTYANISIDFVAVPTTNSINITKINYGSWYQIFIAYITPPFNFNGSKMWSNTPFNVLRRSGSNCWSEQATVNGDGSKLDYSYTDSWSTNSPYVSCSNLSGATGASCSVSPSFSGGNVNITMTRYFPVLLSQSRRHGGWGGVVSLSTYPVTLTKTKTVNIAPLGFTLTTTKSGLGSGTITSSPSGVNCGSDCSEIYSKDTSVTLTSTPQTGSVFTGWSGSGCSGTGACAILMIQDRNVTAIFNILPTVNLSANPTSIEYGANSTLSWTSSNATSCMADIAWSGVKALLGSENTGSLTLDKVYRLTCNGTYGSSQDMVTVFVTPPAQCEDGIDNNDSGVFDANDPGCWIDFNDSNTYDPKDDDEGNYECSDGIDNDGDGQTDYPNDTSCLSVAGDNESIPVCGNTVCETGESPSNCSIDCTVIFSEF